MNHLPKRLSSVLPIGGVIFTMLALIWGGVIGYLYQGRAALLENERDQQLIRLSYYASQAQEAFRTTDLALQSIAIAVRNDVTRGHRREDRAMYDLLRETTELLPSVRSLFVIESDGLLRHSSIAYPNPPFDSSQTKHFLAHSRDHVESFIDQPLVGRLTGRWFINVSRRISDIQGNFMGVAGAAVEPDIIARGFQDRSLRSQTQVMLALPGGIVLAAHPALDAQDRGRIGTRLDQHLAIDPAALARLSPGQRHVLAIPGWIASATQVPQFSLIVVMGRPVKAILSDWYRNVVVFLGLVSVLTLLAMVGLALISRQFRARAMAEAAIRAANERFELAVHHSQDGIWDWDLASELIWMSPPLRHLLGLRPQFAVMPVVQMRALIHAEDREALAAAVSRLRDGQDAALTSMFRIHHGADRWIWLEIRVGTARGEDGRVNRLVGTARDVTQQRQVDAQMAQAQKMQSLGTLASGVAHNFNNVLQAVILLIGLARRQKQAEAARPLLERALAAAENGAQMVREILLFTRADSSEQHLCDFGAIVRASMELIQVTAPSSVKLATHLIDRPLPIIANENQFQQVVATLVINAIQACGRRGAIEIMVDLVDGRDHAPPTVSGHDGPDSTPYIAAASASHDYHRLWVGPSHIGPCGLLRVSDHGAGMDVTVLERILEPFFTTKQVGEGTGLGLSVLLGIVNAHRGQICVRTRPGHGTAFDILLPLQLEQTS